MSYRSYKRNCKRFLKWLKIQQYNIYDGDTVNIFTRVFQVQSSYEGRILYLSKSDRFVTKQFSSFVLIIRGDGLYPIGQFTHFRDYGAELLKHNIGLIIVHHHGAAITNAIDTALCISDDHLFDNITTTYSGYGATRFVFEENLHSYLSQKDEVLKRYIGKVA
jgi:hypothetical protein